MAKLFTRKVPCVKIILFIWKVSKNLNISFDHHSTYIYRRKSVLTRITLDDGIVIAPIPEYCIPPRRKPECIL